MKNTTLVTGIWDLGRSELGEGWSRSFDHYIEAFKKLLSATKEHNLAVFIDKKHESVVWDVRNKSDKNIVIYNHPKENFNSSFFPFYEDVQKIRNNPDWYNQVGWLKESTQAKMEWYNPMVMSKMFMLHNAKCFNPFDTDYYFWVDGGIANTVHPGYFSHDKVIEKIEKFVRRFFFVCFPYETNSEIHGFDIEGMKKFANSEKVNRVARGGFFGGHKDEIPGANDLYYGLLRDSLSQGYMGTEESIFTLMTYLQPEVYQYESILDNGLLSYFFENVKDDKIQLNKEYIKKQIHETDDVNLYMVGFNSPDQMEMVCKSYEKYEPKFLSKTKKFLINNSTKEDLFPKYDEICEKYGFEQIKQGNIGINRARQLAAEHFKKSKAKYMFFFEDDMLIDLNPAKCCKVGFKKNVQNLYDTLIRIMDKEDYDFLKFSFAEFFGDNSEQWSWHNVPGDRKIEYFGDRNSRPLTRFTNIKTVNKTPYIEGEIYYSNWPHIISQEGNQKMFMDTEWAHPYEQTWMSHIYTLTKENKVKPAILLASPITHNRVHHYEASERKEN